MQFYRYSVNYDEKWRRSDEPTSTCSRPFSYNAHAHPGGQNEAGDLYAVRVVISN